MPKLGVNSIRNLRGVHPDLVRVVRRAIQITSQDFSVLEGLRSEEKQRENVAKGVSQTMHSKHLTGHAVDLTPYPLDWDDVNAFRAVGHAILVAAMREGVKVTWGATAQHGGDWRTFNDMPHFEIDPAVYPMPEGPVAV